MKKKKSKKKIILLVSIAVLTALLIWALALLSREAGTDARFIRDLDRGLTASWAQKNDEFRLQKKEEGMSTGFIDLEYSAVSAYKGQKFRNKKLGKLAQTYIASLEACREAAKAADPNEDFNKFWEAFSEPYGERIKAVYSIYKGKYDLELDDSSYKKKKNMFLAQGWILQKVDNISISRKENKDGTVTLKAKVKNDSGFDLKYVNLDLELYNKKGKAVEKLSIFAKDIKKGAEFELLGYQLSGSKIDGYKIVSETCEIRQ